MAEKTDRLISLDVFRGLTIIGMILVNNPGNWSFVYPALRHASWHGVTPTDLIFPFFLFIVGVAITLSFAKRLEKGDSKKKLVFHVVKRSGIIFALGLILNGFPYYDFSIIRIPGVLQRIAIVYMVASIIYLYSTKKSLIIWLIGLLLFYSGMMMFYPVAGFGAGNLSKEGNFAAFFDRLFLMGHMWSGSKTWDPEGMFSTLPAICTTLFGILTGFLIKSEKTKEEKAILLFVWGSVLSVLGVIIDMWIPINKPIWTTSYSVYTAGMALLFLGICYYIIDIKGNRKFVTPFLVFGMNAITVFFLSGIVGRLLTLIKVSGPANTQVTLGNWFYTNLFASWLGQMNGSLGYAIFYIFFWMGLMWILYAKKIFIKV